MQGCRHRRTLVRVRGEVQVRRHVREEAGREDGLRTEVDRRLRVRGGHRLLRRRLLRQQASVLALARLRVVFLQEERRSHVLLLRVRVVVVVDVVDG